MNKQIRKQIIVEIIALCIYILLTAFYYHIDKFTSGIFYLILILLIPIAFIVIIVYFFKGIILIFRNQKSLSCQIIIPLIISFISLAYIFLLPNFDSEKLESKVILRGCYEGTQNQATLKFKEDKTFEIHSTGVFFSSSWSYGTYEQRNDTFYLNYETEKPYRFGDSIIIRDENFITINQYKIDSSQYFIPFYLGYCKGLN